MKFALLLLALVLAVPIITRLWPVSADKWHVDPFSAPKVNARFCPEPGSRFADSAPSLEPLAAVADNWPRTTRLAGSVADGRITWVTRSRIMGYPDVTTAEVRDGQLCIVARQVIGSQDWGVNAERLNQWALAAYGVNPEL